MFYRFIEKKNKLFLKKMLVSCASRFVCVGQSILENTMEPGFFFWGGVGAGHLQINFSNRTIIFFLLPEKVRGGVGAGTPKKNPAYQTTVFWYENKHIRVLKIA